MMHGRDNIKIFIQIWPAPHFYSSTKEYLRISALSYFNLIRQEKNETEEKSDCSVWASKGKWNAMAVQLFGEMLLNCHSLHKISNVSKWYFAD
jgi:hypothetical protein